MLTKSNFKGFLSLINGWVIIPIIFICAVAFAAIFPDLTITNNITVGGTVDGRDVAADGSTLDNLNTTLGLGSLTAAEVTQLQNIDTETISNTQWGFVGAGDQGVATGDTPQFAGVLTDTVLNLLEISTPSNPATNRWKIYIKSDGLIYKLDEAGTETQVDVGASTVAFRVRQGSVQTITSGVFTKVDMTAELFDVGGYFDISADRYTPLVAGHYQINVNIGYTAFADAAEAECHLRKNAAAYAAVVAHGSNTSAIGCSVSAIVFFNGSTDFVEAFTNQNTGSNKSIATAGDFTTFSGAFISP